MHDGGHDGCVVCQRAVEESEGDKVVSYEVDAVGRFFQRCRWTLVPPFSAKRVSPQGEGGGDCSALDERDLAMLALRYPWPVGVELCLPTAEGRSRQAYNRCMVVFTAALDYGFRLPIPPLYQDFINCHRVSPSQISPNSWQFMAGYVAACRVGSIEANARHMSCVLPTKEASGLLTLCFTGSGLMKKKDASRGWRPNWFLVRAVGDFSFGCTGTPLPPHFSFELRADEKQSAREELKAVEISSVKDSSFPSWKDLETLGLSLQHPRRSQGTQALVCRCASCCAWLRCCPCVAWYSLCYSFLFPPQ